MLRALVVVALIIGAALRLYPLDRPFIHPDQELLPMQALCTLVTGDWRPRQLAYPSGYLYLLRSSYRAMLWWGARGGAGPHDAADLFSRYLDDPFPFYAVARAWSCLFGIVTIWLTARLAARVVGPGAGGIAALVLAVSFLAVRESHYGSVDATATAVFVAALLAAARIVDAPRPHSIVVAGLLAGLAAGTRYQLGIVALAVPIAVAFGGGPMSSPSRVGWLVVAGASALAAFAIASPYTLLEADRAWAEIALQLRYSYFGFSSALSVPEALVAAVGWPVCVLAAVGVVVAARKRPVMVALVLVTTVPYAWALHQASRSFLRYVLPLVPVLAVFAARGTLAVGGLVPARLRTAATTLLVGLVLIDPCGRAIVLDGLLARPDTRDRAGVWLLEHARPDDRVWLPPPLSHSTPTLPLELGTVAWRCGPEVANGLRSRRPRPAFATAVSSARPDQLARMRHAGGLVVTAEHPVLTPWATTPPEVAALVQERGTIEARFVGLEADRAPATLFETIDANFVPLRGLTRVETPGPTLTIWRLPPSP
ncbi:MAG: glycosyltransferase family 39 protein [Candidatus Binatia bacterium]